MEEIEMGKNTKDTDSVVTYRRADGRQAMTHVTKEQREALERGGRLVKDHGHGGKGR